MRRHSRGFGKQAAVADGQVYYWVANGVMWCTGGCGDQVTHTHTHTKFCSPYCPVFTSHDGQMDLADSFALFTQSICVWVCVRVCVHSPVPLHTVCQRSSARLSPSVYSGVKCSDISPQFFAAFFSTHDNEVSREACVFYIQPRSVGAKQLS